jgi:hypothetical protein
MGYLHQTWQNQTPVLIFFFNFLSLDFREEWVKAQQKHTFVDRSLSSLSLSPSLTHTHTDQISPFGYKCERRNWVTAERNEVLGNL